MSQDGNYRRQWTRYQMVCAVCGKSFEAHRSHAKYCSARCRKRAAVAGGAAWRRDFYCQQCGKQHFPKQPNQINLYCSGACKQAAYRARKREA